MDKEPDQYQPHEPNTEHLIPVETSVALRNALTALMPAGVPTGVGVEVKLAPSYEREVRVYQESYAARTLVVWDLLNTEEPQEDPELYCYLVRTCRINPATGAILEYTEHAEFWKNNEYRINEISRPLEQYIKRLGAKERALFRQLGQQLSNNFTRAKEAELLKALEEIRQEE